MNTVTKDRASLATRKNEELIAILMAISVVASLLADKLRQQQQIKEERHHGKET